MIGEPDSCHCEFHTGLPADPRRMKPAFAVMAGLVLARPGHDGESEAKSELGCLLGVK
jgi:hypothetical protein